MNKKLRKAIEEKTKMSKKLREAIDLTTKELSKAQSSKAPLKQLFLYVMDYAYDNGYGHKIIELFDNYLKGEK